MSKKSAESIAIKKLKELERCWPSTLWLYSASGALHVMRKGSDGKRVMNSNERIGFCPDASIYSTSAIDNDGGDW